jgi:hypothetical protein
MKIDKIRERLDKLQQEIKEITVDFDELLNDLEVSKPVKKEPVEVTITEEDIKEAEELEAIQEAQEVPEVPEVPEEQKADDSLDVEVNGVKVIKDRYLGHLEEEAEYQLGKYRSYIRDYFDYQQQKKDLAEEWKAIQAEYKDEGIKIKEAQKAVRNVKEFLEENSDEAVIVKKVEEMIQKDPEFLATIKAMIPEKKK